MRVKEIQGAVSIAGGTMSNHVESLRLYELAKLDFVTTQPEWDHVMDCQECGLAFLTLRAITERMITETPPLVS